MQRMAEEAVLWMVKEERVFRGDENINERNEARLDTHAEKYAFRLDVFFLSSCVCVTFDSLNTDSPRVHLGCEPHRAKVNMEKETVARPNFFPFSLPYVEASPYKVPLCALSYRVSTLHSIAQTHPIFHRSASGNLFPLPHFLVLRPGPGLAHMSVAQHRKTERRFLPQACILYPYPRGDHQLGRRHVFPPLQEKLRSSHQVGAAH